MNNVSLGSSVHFQIDLQDREVPCQLRRDESRFRDWSLSGATARFCSSRSISQRCVGTTYRLWPALESVGLVIAGRLCVMKARTRVWVRILRCRRGYRRVVSRPFAIILLEFPQRLRNAGYGSRQCRSVVVVVELMDMALNHPSV